jgi:hypothetical protein
MEGWRQTITLRRPKKIPRPPIPFKATLPKILARQIGREVNKTCNNNDCPASGPESDLSGSNASSGRPIVHVRQVRPKGCFCQIGSAFKAVLVLFLILGVTGGIVAWIYHTKFSSKVTDKDKVMVPADADIKQNELNSLGERIVKLIKSSDPDLYIDSEGNLRLLSELELGAKKEKFGRNDLAPPGVRMDFVINVDDLENGANVTEEIDAEVIQPDPDVKVGEEIVGKQQGLVSIEVEQIEFVCCLPNSH